MKVFIYGRGKGSEYVKRCVADSRFIFGYVDNNYDFDSDIEQSNCNIIKHEDLISKQIEFDYVIVSLMDWKSIYEWLIKSGVDRDKIIRFFSFEDADKQCYYSVLDPFKWRIELIWRKLKNEILPLADNITYELYADCRINDKEIPIIKSADEAIDRIINEKISIARFGDGEFEIIAGRNKPVFQKADHRLGERLKEVLESEDDRLLIGIANNYGKLDDYTDDAAKNIRKYLNHTVREEHLALLKKDRVYYDAYLSRPYIIYRNKSDSEQRFYHLKQIWNNKKVLVIEGDHTRTGVGNDLLSGAVEVSRIIVPDKNAFDYYDIILRAAMTYGRNRLILISVGPTATVLAYDLALAGYWAIDIGQIDIEYEWYIRKKGERCAVAGKIVNEIPAKENIINSNNVEDISAYKDQIVFKVNVK